MTLEAVLVADIHLSEDTPEITANFLHFLQHYASRSKALYILGDLFEVWIGDDDPSILHQHIADAIKQLTEQGVACYFICGNRDFLIGQEYAKRSHLTLLPQETILTTHGKRIVILHGDTLCTDDKSYQYLRRLFHCSIVQRLFLCLPLSWRMTVAKKMRQKSRQFNRQKQTRYLDVNPQAVQQVMQRHQASMMIHGHTHRAAVHQQDSEQPPVTRIVLGAWDQHAEVAIIQHGDVSLHPLSSLPELTV